MPACAKVIPMTSSLRKKRRTITTERSPGMTRHRIARVQQEVQKRGFDALLVSSLLHIRYLTGFTGTNGLLILTPTSSILLTDVRYALHVREEVKTCKRIIVSQRGLLEEAARRGLFDTVSKVGFAAAQVTYAQYRSMRKLFPHVSFASTHDIVEEAIIVKDAEEIAQIRAAVKISDRVFGEVVKVMRPGVRELEIAAEISYLHRMFGAEGDAFETIVASGERSAFPHARASQKRIRSGELVTLDFGCVVNGYHSDITRKTEQASPPALRRSPNGAGGSHRVGAWRHVGARLGCRGAPACCTRRLRQVLSAFAWSRTGIACA
ncbi:MAG: hypothetical protein C4326_00810 [Ignavibacteria bacterium]